MRGPAGFKRTLKKSEARPAKGEGASRQTLAGSPRSVGFRLEMVMLNLMPSHAERPQLVSRQRSEVENGLPVMSGVFVSGTRRRVHCQGGQLSVLAKDVS